MVKHGCPCMFACVLAVAAATSFATPAAAITLGMADTFQFGANGGVGAGSRLTAIAGPQWTGNYLAAGVDAITLDIHNFGSTTLQLRLWLTGLAGSSALSSIAVVVPAGSGWTPARFALDTSALTG